NVVEPRSDFDLPIRELRREQLLCTAGVGCLAIAAAIIASRRFSVPLRQLTDAAEKITHGDWRARADVNTHDEIGELAHTFNDMVPKLKERAKMEDALRLAMEIQRHLLPKNAPKIAGLDVAGVNIPADQTGGDY